MKTIFSVELLELNCRKPLFTDPVVATNLQEFLSSNSTLTASKWESVELTQEQLLASSLSNNKTLTKLKFANEKVEIDTIILSLANNRKIGLRDKIWEWPRDEASYDLQLVSSAWILTFKATNLCHQGSPLYIHMQE